MTKNRIGKTFNKRRQLYIKQERTHRQQEKAHHNMKFNIIIYCEEGPFLRAWIRIHFLCVNKFNPDPKHCPRHASSTLLAKVLDSISCNFFKIILAIFTAMWQADTAT
jgi:hypothetical protein